MVDGMSEIVQVEAYHASAPNIDHNTRHPTNLCEAKRRVYRLHSRKYLLIL